MTDVDWQGLLGFFQRRAFLWRWYSATNLMNAGDIRAAKEKFTTLKPDSIHAAVVGAQVGFCLYRLGDYTTSDRQFAQVLDQLEQTPMKKINASYVREYCEFYRQLIAARMGSELNFEALVERAIQMGQLGASSNLKTYYLICPRVRDLPRGDFP